VPRADDDATHPVKMLNPEDRYEVEVRGEEYLILRECDVHAVASERIEGETGLYL
jgi:chaperonin GroES